MSYRDFAIKLFKKYGIEFDEFNGNFKGIRNNTQWFLRDTCSWDNCYQLTYGEYKANRISIKTAVKKILSI